uniref:Uncharacterized protein n=1 Tax=Panagrolaimus sp. PS1159 TaxID=55785 RepID=A0AC35GEA9_9BILA
MMNKMLVLVFVALMLTQCSSASLKLSPKNQEQKMKPVERYSCNPDCFNYCVTTYVNNVDGFSSCIKSCGC